MHIYCYAPDLHKRPWFLHPRTCTDTPTPILAPAPRVVGHALRSIPGHSKRHDRAHQPLQSKQTRRRRRHASAMGWNTQAGAWAGAWEGAGMLSTDTQQSIASPAPSPSSPSPTATNPSSPIPA